MSAGFITRTLRGFTSALERTLIAENAASKPGLMQALDPRVKLVGLLALVISAALSHRLNVLAGLFMLGVVLAVASHLSLRSLAKSVWLVVFVFTFLIAAPALFLTPGQVAYSFPQTTLTITVQGLRAALLLVGRVETAVTFSTLLILTTPWMHLLKALRCLRVPVEIIAMLAMTHRYVVLLMETSNAMFESRRSRMVGRLNGRQQRQLAINTGGVLMSKTLEMGNQVYLAMQARGFRGDVQLLTDFRMRRRDYAALVGFAFVTCAAVVMGR